MPLLSLVSHDNFSWDVLFIPHVVGRTLEVGVTMLGGDGKKLEGDVTMLGDDGRRPRAS